MEEKTFSDTLESLTTVNARLLAIIETDRGEKAEALRKAAERYKKRKVSPAFVKVYPASCQMLLEKLRSNQLAVLFGIMTMVEYKTNKVVKDGFPATISDISRTMHLDSKQVAKILKVLEEQGIIFRTQAKPRGRAWFEINRDYCFMGE